MHYTIPIAGYIQYLSNSRVECALYEMFPLDQRSRAIAPYCVNIIYHITMKNMSYNKLIINYLPSQYHPWGYEWMMRQPVLLWASGLAHLSAVHMSVAIVEPL